jgi:DNA-binding CsgD family transcriptional regulator
VRALLRLCNALHEAPPDPTARKRRMLQALCRLLRADAAVCVVSHTGAAGGPRRRSGSVVSTARWAVSPDDAKAMAALSRPRAGAGGWRGRPPSRRAVPSGYEATDHCLRSAVTVPGVRMRACVTLLRRPAGRRRFTDRERAVLDLFHGEMDWLYRADLPVVTSDAQDLTPRQRQTLQLLLAGNGEKQIASLMDIRPNTVHHYVKALYRHFAVTSRSELLARWVRK